MVAPSAVLERGTDRGNSRVDVTMKLPYARTEAHRRENPSGTAAVRALARDAADKWSAS
jgi:hypothetical protein